MRNDWLEVELRTVCSVHSGYGFPKKFQGKKNGDYPFYKVGDISKNVTRGNQYLKECDNYINQEIISQIKGKIIPNHSVVFAKIGEALKLNRRAITSVPCLIDNNAIGIKGSLAILDLFLYYKFLTIKLEDYSRATTVPSIRKSDIESIRLPLPPLPEQRAIVAKIEQLFSELDNSIANFKKAQAQLKVYRQAVLKKAFEGELTKEWREQQTELPTADELLEQIEEERLKHYENQLRDWEQEVGNWEANGKAGKKPGKPKLNKPLPEFDEAESANLNPLPENWKWVKNENYLFEVKDGTHDSPKYIEHGVPFITQKNIKNNQVSFDDIRYIKEEDHNKFYKRSNVAKGDIIIAMIGHNRGNCCIVQTEEIFSIKNVGLFKFFPIIQINKYNLYYYQSTLGLNLALKKSKGGAQPFIGLTELRNWPIPICSLEEQIQIVQEIESRLSVCDKLEETLAESLEKAEALRQSILKKAFNGELLTDQELETCRQQPDWEPAEVLLERIKKEKAK